MPLHFHSALPSLFFSNIIQLYLDMAGFKNITNTLSTDNFSDSFNISVGSLFFLPKIQNF